MDKSRKIERIRSASPSSWPSCRSRPSRPPAAAAPDEGGGPPGAWKDVRNETALKQHQAIAAYWGVAAEASDRVDLAIGAVRSASRSATPRRSTALRRQVAEALLAAHAIDGRALGAARELKHAPAPIEPRPRASRPAPRTTTTGGFKSRASTGPRATSVLVEAAPG